ncbi:MAG: hypothetical protein COA84_14850 [Robiginitomaculum sp.]|nr:MAG: hypothetical protein COA84_14850 [Robiginitomaculum sp.]
MNPIILNNLPNILGFIAISLFVFILIREVICWYFKINERVQLQKEVIYNQELLFKLLSHRMKK